MAENKPSIKKKSAPTQPRSVAVVNAQNQKVQDLALHPEVFGVRVNEHLLYEAVKQHRAGARRGTHATKTRAMVSGTGKKPWRQKGTGRARVGEARNPLWRHGGTVHGPQPRSYELAMPKKARLAALRAALSQRVNEGALKVVDRIEVSRPASPPFRLAHQVKAFLGTLGLEGKTLIVESQPGDELVLGSRNIPGVKLVDADHLNVYDLLEAKQVLVSQAALNKLEERLTP